MSVVRVGNLFWNLSFLKFLASSNILGPFWIFFFSYIFQFFSPTWFMNVVSVGVRWRHLMWFVSPSLFLQPVHTTRQDVSPFSWLYLWILSFLIVPKIGYSTSESHKNHLFNALWMRRASENFKWEDLQTNEKHQSQKFQIWRQIWTYVVSIFCHITKSFVAKLWRLNFETFSFSLLDSYDTWVCSSAWSLFPKRNFAELFNIVKDYCVCQNINLGG